MSISLCSVRIGRLILRQQVQFFLLAILFSKVFVSVSPFNAEGPLLPTKSGHEVYMWSLVSMAGGEGATQRVTRSMSEAMQESGKKDRVKELLRTALETAGWRESVRLASDSVIAEAHPTKLSAKEIAAAVRESALGTLLSPRPWKYDRSIDVLRTKLFYLTLTVAIARRSLTPPSTATFAFDNLLCRISAGRY
jgi:hypothetical protein